MAENIIEVALGQVNVHGRFRKEFGDIPALAQSIADLGLLQPIGIDSGYRLVFGERRLRAFQHLGRDKIPARFVNLDSLVKGELAENEFRKEFTQSERAAIGEALEGELREQAEKRMKAGVSPPKENFPEGQDGQVRDLAAKAAGFGNGKTYEQAKKVSNEAAPELVKAMDEGRASVSAAAALLTLPKDEQATVAAGDKKTIQAAAKTAKARTQKPEAVKPAGTPHVLQVINAMDNLVRYLQRESMTLEDMADVFMAEVDLSSPAIADRIKATLPVMREIGNIARDLEMAA